MPIAEFEEKQYETSANIELGLQHAAVFAAGQVLESVVGYDVAAHPPANAPIWRLMGVSPAPQGLLLVPNLWQRAKVQPRAPELPSTYVSLVLQYKRPRYLSTKRSVQWNHWHAPYFRFTIEQHQQDILGHLANALAARALVRYACAAFWTYNDLQTNQAAHTVLKQSAFVSPAALMGHKKWTYVSPGTTGWANSTGKSIPTQTFRQFWAETKKLGKKTKESLFQHLRGLAVELGVPRTSDAARAPWLRRLSEANRLDAVQRQSVIDILELAMRFGEAGASWFVADLENPNP